MASDPDISSQADYPEQDKAAQNELGGVDTKSGSITAGNVTGTGIAIGPGAQANVIFTEEQAYNVSGLSNPYLGLRPFTAAERNIFAGRERIVRTLVDRLSADDGDRLLFIVGASGSGKSSLARAGILPTLADRLHNQGYAVQIHIIDHPGRLPGSTLPRLREDFHGALDSSSIRFHLILMDQAEELFSQGDPKERDLVLHFLAEVAATVDLPVRMIVTLRSDFLPQLVVDARFEGAERRKVIVRTMSEDELRDAIQRPIAVHHPDKRIEPALVERLARDAAADAAYLPLLQVTLEDLWRGGELRLSHYRGLADAIQRRADTVYTYLDYDGLQQETRTSDEQRAMLDLFLDLVQVSLAEEQQVVRWRRQRAELTQADPQRERFIADLANARLLRTDREVVQADGSEREIETVDIVHEALLREWPTLTAAIEREREVLRRRVRFDLALTEWMTHKQHDAYLLIGVRLAEGESLAAQDDITLRSVLAQDFLQRSREVHAAAQQRKLAEAEALARSEQRAAQRLRWLSVLLLILASIAPGRWLYGQFLRWESRAELIRIHGGLARIGDSSDDRAAPPWTIHVDPFLLEQHEVSKRQYARCVWDGACSIPVDRLRYALQPDTEPIVGVTALEAEAYCSWIGRRLPSEVEWEWAARGQQARQWVWPAVPTSHSLLVANIESSKPWPVLQAGDDRTPEGVLNLGGNVMEWTATRYDAYPGQQSTPNWNAAAAASTDTVAIRGGSYLGSMDQALLFARSAWNILNPQIDLGFRCATSR
jgi:formylglycine-generating enzyme required for sulfatase activity/ABC-type dipeptide/oligopeptide/nickel transport system ATPase component